MSEIDPKNRRRTPRTELLLKVSYASSHELLADYITDLGAGGMFVRTDAPFRIGESLAFDLSFPALQQLLRTLRMLMDVSTGWVAG